MEIAGVHRMWHLRMATSLPEAAGPVRQRHSLMEKEKDEQGTSAGLPWSWFAGTFWMAG
jgi:hypothetical protein